MTVNLFNRIRRLVQLFFRARLFAVVRGELAVELEENHRARWNFLIFLRYRVFYGHLPAFEHALRVEGAPAH